MTTKIPQKRVSEAKVALYLEDGWKVLYWVKQAFANGRTVREAQMVKIGT